MEFSFGIGFKGLIGLISSKGCFKTEEPDGN